MRLSGELTQSGRSAAQGLSWRLNRDDRGRLVTPSPGRREVAGSLVRAGRNGFIGMSCGLPGSGVTSSTRNAYRASTHMDPVVGKALLDRAVDLG